MSRSLLNSNVLVLNRSWQATNVISARRAVSLVYKQLANVVNKIIGDDNKEYFEVHNFNEWKDLSIYAVNEYISSINFKFMIPEIIILTKFDKLHKRETKYTRHNIYTRDKYRCIYCGRNFKHNKSKLSIDHIIPKSKGGQDTWENTACACYSCNSKKADKLLHETDMKLLWKPTKPNWKGSGLKSLVVGKPVWIEIAEMD